MDTPTPPPSRPPPSARAAPPAQPPPPATPPAATAAGDAPAPVVELHRSRSSSQRASWLWVALPVGGLMIVPLVGLFYTTTTTFGKGDADAATSADVDVDGELTGAGPPGSKKKRPAKKPTTAGGRKSTLRARSDSAAICCAKLHELGKTEPLEARGPYLGAAAACEAAPDAETALRRVASNLRTSKSDVPPECE